MVAWHLPIKTASEGNCSEHWAIKAKRHKKQKAWIKVTFLKERPCIKLPVHIVLTRIAPRMLDEHDILRSSLKWVVDALAECLIPGKAAGRADDSKLITWEYHQQKGSPREYAVKIEFKGRL